MDDDNTVYQWRRKYVRQNKRFSDQDIKTIHNQIPRMDGETNDEKTKTGHNIQPDPDPGRPGPDRIPDHQQYPCPEKRIRGNRRL